MYRTSYLSYAVHTLFLPCIRLLKWTFTALRRGAWWGTVSLCRRNPKSLSNISREHCRLVERVLRCDVFVGYSVIW